MTIVCAICQREVSKRQSLSLVRFGLGEGRACRSHEEVREAVERWENLQRERSMR
jgi:hypothetical protein